MVEQLKEYGYQIRPKHEWIRVASFASDSPTAAAASSSSSSRYLFILFLTLIVGLVPQFFSNFSHIV